MNASNYDVIIVGAGAAGLTAAIGLARAGFSVVAVEAAPFPGAENWSGCVYFCENLVHSAILGPEGVETLAWERRLVERGFFASDGYALLGMKYRDPPAFRHCYTVLRPIYDHHLAQVAQRYGAAVMTNTTVESLIREGGRVIGVCTQRGALYADLVYLAEGDASHLVTREGYERYTDQRAAPKFLQGIKQVIHLPPGAIEERFRLRAEEGIAYEILLRNGTLAGRPASLNMGGFVYSNRQSLSVGLVLPADNLRAQFNGDPNLLMEWFLNLPALRPWLRDGERGVFGAKIIRGGGARDIPNLVDDGLAVGGAASAIGVDFPYPNFTGPATAMGLLITQAACRIRDERGRFDRDNLRRHYLEPLQQTHYWNDVEFLRRWPGYVKRTTAFFDRNLDLVLGTAYVWTRPNRWFVTKWVNWIRLLLQVSGPSRWAEMRADFRHLIRALRLKEVISRPTLGRLFLDGTINALRDLAGSPRANLPTAGSFNVVYSVADDLEPVGLPPAAWRKWFRRLAPVLASGARRVYLNNKEPLGTKLPETSHLLMRQINLLDFISFVFFAFAAALTGGFMLAWQRLSRALTSDSVGRTAKGLYPRYLAFARQAGDMDGSVSESGRHWDTRLSNLAYFPVKTSHIHVLWPRSLSHRGEIVNDALWHVCPAHVYEARVTEHDQVQVIVNFENCIKCETCWRTSEIVDWGRDGKHRFIYPVASPVISRLLSGVDASALARCAPPHLADRWEALSEDLVRRIDAGPAANTRESDRIELSELSILLDNLRGKLDLFEEALARAPRTVDRARSESLEALARYAQQLSLRIVDILRGATWGESSNPGLTALYGHLLQLASSMLAKAEERTRRTWDQHPAWAAADGRQLSYHHVTGLRRLITVLYRKEPQSRPQVDELDGWLAAEHAETTVQSHLSEWKARLDAAFPPGTWRAVEATQFLNDAQDQLLREMVRQVPRLDPTALAATLHPPLRKALLGELGRRDPALAYLVACHLWARDLAALNRASPPFAEAAERWVAVQEWACFAVLEDRKREDTWTGTASFVPAGRARMMLALSANQAAIIPIVTPSVESLPTLGLRGAGLSEVKLDKTTPLAVVDVDPEYLTRVRHILSSADLVSIASGMAAELCTRSIAHAKSRIQFPGLFHDEEAHDSIAKFGAIKKMIAQIAARRYVIETLDHCLTPSDFAPATFERALLVKAVAAEALGTAPGSASYNAGQVFGGTGYSEDDILAKFYRDSSAWRFLGEPNPEIYRRHGQELLASWHSDGRRLATVSGEADLFEQVAQRKALQTELDEIRVFRSRLRALINDWTEQTPDATSHQVNGALTESRLGAERAELIARQDGQLLASKALLLRTHARWEKNWSAEIESVLTRVWLDEAAASLEQLEAVQRLRHSSIAQDRPLGDPAAPRMARSYADYLTRDLPYDSGDFLTTATDLTRPRLVPEMVQSDPVLAARDSELRDLIAGHFGEPRDGMIYERYIESRHRPDDSDLDFCRKHGFFRMPIPKALGGEGRPKIDYYLLIIHAQRLADVGISLCIQVNTSIGTTPILLARDRELPRARKEIEAFVQEPAIQDGIASRFERLLAVAAGASPRRVEQVFADTDCEVDKFLARTALKNLAPDVVEAWSRVRRVRQDRDRQRFVDRIKDALDQWRAFCGRVPVVSDELARRVEACDLALQWIASGQISAFALTEPSAGSDTARVATRARRSSCAIEPEPDGALRFYADGHATLRYLLDARKLHFRPDGAFYRWSDREEPSRIYFDEYDYETDRQKNRYYDHGGRRIYFTDIAQLRERDGKLWYDYWELTGAKMWITNGRMAGIFCLYAKTTEGVTGFIVDRHAEGLVVGKDEAKLGQWGSPTNELSLQAVRVPLENVLGVEGRGQVNALEALNVGRAGLAISGMAQMAGIIGQALRFAAESHGALPAWVEHRLNRMEEDRFVAEALAYEIVGRFEHPQTRSVRMESAIAKTLVSEILHRVIETAEEIYGLAGQTHRHLIEKRKRDNRVYSIYEGTNEIQRFFILKDLITEIIPRWRKNESVRLPNYMSPEALEIETLKAGLRQRVLSAADVFGQQLWQNANLQASCFLLAEAVAWLKAAESTLARRAWLEQDQEEDGEPQPLAALGRRATGRCIVEVRTRLRRFEEDLSQLRRGYYGPEIRAASLLLAECERPVPGQRSMGAIERPISILVLVEPTVAVPRPQIAHGRLLEPYFTLDAADQSAIETALLLRDQAESPVWIEVAAAGPRRYAQALRDLVHFGFDRVRLVISDSEGITPQNAAQAIALAVGDRVYDLVLYGAGDRDGQEGLVGRLAAAALGVHFGGEAAAIRVSARESVQELTLFHAGGRGVHTRSLPSAVGITAGAILRPFSTTDFLRNASRGIEMGRWPKKLPVQTVSFSEAPALVATKADDEAIIAGPEQVAKQTRLLLGFEDCRPIQMTQFEGIIREVVEPSLLEAGILAVVATDADGHFQQTGDVVLRTAALAAVHEKLPLAALVLVPPSEAAERCSVGEILEKVNANVVLCPLPRADLPAELKSQVVSDCLAGRVPNLQMAVGEAWTEDAFISLSQRPSHWGLACLRARRLDIEEDHLFVEANWFHNKLRARQPVVTEPGSTWWIQLSPDAEIAAPPSRLVGPAARVERWGARLGHLYTSSDMHRLLEELKEAVGVVRLGDAAVIIDVGFGVGNRDGYEAVIEPLERCLRQLGVRGLMIGGSRKVTEELHLLPPDRQIGQSGVSVNPRILLAVGVSGAPQHLNYIGSRACIVAFNRDPDAPIMTLNQRTSRPRVWSVVGDLFETVPAFISALSGESSPTPKPQPDTQRALV
jgi:alkylation response protein AidB-like acyl-CoA dehydrogenase/flavin-dependent dehydrogenase/ferredoxin-like protein FixX